MASLDPRLGEILTMIVETYDAPPPDQRGRLLHLRWGGGQGFHSWPEGGHVVTRDDIDELLDGGLIDVDYSPRDANPLVKPTREGRDLVRRQRREEALAEHAGPVDLGWPAVRPVLHAVVDLWSENGASPSTMIFARAVADRLGRPHDDLALRRSAEQLAAADWLDLDYDEEDRMLLAPTMRGVMATRNWPGGDGEIAAERLLTALDELVAGEPDEQQRGRLARLRDVAMEVGTKTLAEVVSKSVGNAV